MTVGILYPDIVTVDIAHLSTALGITCHAREPNPFPTTDSNNTPTVTVRRSGGADSVVIDRPRVDIQVWHSNLADATDLANLCRAHMLAMPGVRSGVTVYKVTTFSGPSLIWDTDRNLPRLLLSFEQLVRGTAL